MDPAHLKELIRLEDDYWWHVAKRELVCAIVERTFPSPARLVEGGIGSGRNLLTFREMGYDVVGMDISETAVRHVKECGIPEVHQHDLGQPWPMAEASMDVVVLLDVLEHIENPVEALAHAGRSLRPGGGIVITVPAYPSLYGEWDRRLGHFRRYTAKALRIQAAEAGLSVRSLTHWNSIALPPAIVSRGLDRVFRRHRETVFPPVSRPVNLLLKRSARAERWLLFRTGIPLGLSLVGVLVK